MKELLEILLGMAAVAAAFWLYFRVIELIERFTGYRPTSPFMEWQKRRGRIQTLFNGQPKSIDEE